MRRSLLLSMVVIAVATSLLAADQEVIKRARAISKDAYETIYQHPFESQIVGMAAKNLDKAHAMSDKEPYVWLGAAELVLTDGFRSGAFLQSRSYQPGTLDRALAFAEGAIKLDDKLADAHTVAAKILLTLGHFSDSQRELDAARQLDPNGFKPRFYQAVWYWKQGDVARCREALRNAGVVAKTDWEQRTLLYQLEEMAEYRGDEVEHERIHKLLIALDPKRPWPHGNYGWFLLERNRYDEAIAEFEKAVSLGSYPNAEEGLERAKRMRDAARLRH